MKKSYKILLSSLAILALLLGGCTDEEKKAFANANQSSSNNGGDDATPGGDGTIPGSGNGGDGHIPGPGGGSDIPTNPSKNGGWYGRTQVSATAADGKVYTHTTAGIFGELVGSEDTKDKHDIPGYGAAILQVVFPQTAWSEEDNGDYFSNYQSFSAEGSERKVWTFQVKNQHTVDLSNAPIRINLAGIYDVSYKKINGKIVYDENSTVDTAKRNALTLVDVDNATSYTVAELATVNLTMQGLHTRTFRWVQGTVEPSDYTATEKTDADIQVAAAFSEKAKSADINTASFSSAPKVGGKFGLPPQ